MNPLPRDPLCDVSSHTIGLTNSWPVSSTDDISIITTSSRHFGFRQGDDNPNPSQELRSLGLCGLFQLDRGPCGAFPLSGFAYCTVVAVGQPGDLVLIGD